MGDAADNVAAVRKATQILTTRELFQMSNQKVTISTVAPKPESFRELGPHGVLAWSVHAANDQLRKQLVPTTKYKMTELRAGLIDALNLRSPNLRTCMLEVALIANVNDQMEHADELANFAKVIVESVDKCKLIVNLIPFNDIGDGHATFVYEKPSDEQVVAFQRRIWSHGIHTHIRKTRGDEESSACGQLATKRKGAVITAHPLV
jgi:23S rRNA (adenine2503-C2)-methyltransferase